MTKIEPAGAASPPPAADSSTVRILIALALPIWIGNAVQSANVSINAIWVGRLLGKEALAATTNANIVMLLLISLVLGFGLSSSVAIGQLLGRGETASLRRVVGTSLGVVTLAGGILTIVSWLAMPTILHLLGTPPEVEPLARSYFAVLMLSLPAVFLFSVLSNFLRTVGAAMLTLWSLLLYAALDIGLNPLLIAGLFGLPKLGIAGSAWATVLASYLALAATIFLVYRRDIVVRLRGPELAYLRPQRAIWVPILTRGFVIGLQIIVMASSGLALLSLINREGVDAVAAYGVVQQIWTYGQMPAVAVAFAVSALAARFIGERRSDRVDRLMVTAIGVNLIVTSAIYALIVAIGPSLPGLFLGGESVSAAMASHINLIAGWSMLSFGVILVLFGVVRANGVVVVPLVILIVALFPVRLGFAVYFRDWLGPDAIWYSIPVGACVAMVLAIIHYAAGNWRRGRIFDDAGRSE